MWRRTRTRNPATTEELRRMALGDGGSGRCRAWGPRLRRRRRSGTSDAEGEAAPMMAGGDASPMGIPGGGGERPRSDLDRGGGQRRSGASRGGGATGRGVRVTGVGNMGSEGGRLGRPGGSWPSWAGGLLGRSPGGFSSPFFCCSFFFHYLLLFVFCLIHLKVFRHFIKMCFLHYNYLCHFWHSPNILV